MTWSTSISERWYAGSKACSRGTFTASGSETGGVLDTGLHRAEFVSLTPTSTNPAEQCCADEDTWPVPGNSVTLLVTAGVDGIWFAYGDALA